MWGSVRVRWALAALLLASFGVGFAGDLYHTDDGCQVEVHCLACQRVLHSVGVATVAPQWTPSAEPVAQVAATDQVATSAAGAPIAGSRAPPLA